MRVIARGFVSSILVGAGIAATAAAQTTYPNVKLSGRLQEQFYFFDNEDFAGQIGPESNVFTRRARIEARGDISENVSVYIQPSFEGGRNLSGVTPPVPPARSRPGAARRPSPAAPRAEAGCGSGTPTSTSGSPGRRQVGVLHPRRPGEAALQPL